MNYNKAVAALCATSLSVCAINYFQAEAEATSPRIYADIVYEDDDTIRADIYFNDMPDLVTAGFHLEFGDGWEIQYNQFGNVEKHWWISPNLNEIAELSNENTLFVTFAFTEANEVNGRVVSIYLDKTSNNNPTNSTINVSYRSGDILLDSDFQNILSTSPVYNPPMESAYDYVIGDCNGDGLVDSGDASSVFYALSHNNNAPLSVYNIRYTFNYFFPLATCPAAGDADLSGIINTTDASLIMDYYVSVQTGQTYNGIVGTRNYYEVFNLNGV